MRTSRALPLALAIVVVVAVGAAVGYAAHGHGGAAASPLPSRPMVLPATPAPREPVLAGLDPLAPRPVPSAVGRTLAAQLAGLRQGARLVGEVADARTGERLWVSGATRPTPPASTTKLLTAAAALSVLGPQARLTTSTRRLGHTVYLIGGGDPTIVRDRSSYVDPAYPQPATLSALADRTVAALHGGRRIRLRLDPTAWIGPSAAPGWKPSYVTEGDVTPPRALEVDEGRLQPASPQAPRTSHPVQQAGAVFAALLRRRGVKVLGAPAVERTAATARPLGQVQSPPVAALVQRMLTVSDDDLGEALGRAVALHQHQPASFVGAAQAVTSAVKALGVDTRGVSLQDTSGLSHRDRITARALVGLLRLATTARQPPLRAMLAGLPVAGLTGTLADRFRRRSGMPAAGVLRAKTGTLTGVDTLAGVVVDRAGRLLVFALLASRSVSPGVTVTALDKVAARLAGCGCTQ